LLSLHAAALAESALPRLEQELVSQWFIPDGMQQVKRLQVYLRRCLTSGPPLGAIGNLPVVVLPGEEVQYG
jgi:hypothetical protein